MGVAAAWAREIVEARPASSQDNETCRRPKNGEKVIMTNTRSDVSVVLVHAAWFDGSSWNKVMVDLERRGCRVVAAQIPLTSFADDVDTMRRLLRRETGPVVLVGHSYGGAVITAAGAGNSKVKALAYIAAIVPDEGETVGQVFGRTAPHPKAPALQPDSDGFLWLDVEAFHNAVAPDASKEETALMAASQKPISVNCLGEPMTKPAWKEKPSWFLIAENDRMVSPETQRFTAQRMKSNIVSLPVDHTPLASRPQAVADVIEQALDGIVAG
jgi:pimeloyl-ACP methyl ester carboxylesterase